MNYPVECNVLQNIHNGTCDYCYKTKLQGLCKFLFFSTILFLSGMIISINAWVDQKEETQYLQRKLTATVASVGPAWLKKPITKKELDLIKDK